MSATEPNPHGLPSAAVATRADAQRALWLVGGGVLLVWVRRCVPGWLALVALGCAAPAPNPKQPQPLEPSPATLAEHDGKRIPPLPTVADCRAVDASALRFGLVVLGSGGPRSFGRGASGYVVVAAGKPSLLIDAGPGSFVRLGELGFELGSLETVLLTHLHIDHAGDLPGFVKARDLAGDGLITLRIAGPTGAGPYPSTSDFVDRLFGGRGAFAYLAGFRNPLRFEPIDLPTSPPEPRTVVEVDGLRVQAIPVDHADVPAVAYRVEHASRSLVITGDVASRNDNLIQLAAGADLLVYDTSVLDPPGSTEALYELHTPPARIGEVAALARVKSVLLSHITPRVEDHASEVMQSVQAGYAGEVRFARDCLAIELDR